MDDRETILDALPEARGGGVPTLSVDVKAVPKSDLWERFVARLEELGGEVRSLEDLAEFAGKAMCDVDVPQSVVARLGEPATDVWEAKAGVTMAEFAVAETGSIVLSATPRRSRLLSLAPPVHVALVDPGRTIAGLEEAISKMGPETGVIVTGPSRTADVEGVMVMGVHGPRRLCVVPFAP